jgi:hypothetical protein
VKLDQDARRTRPLCETTTRPFTSPQTIPRSWITFWRSLHPPRTRCQRWSLSVCT